MRGNNKEKLFPTLSRTCFIILCFYSYLMLLCCSNGLQKSVTPTMLCCLVQLLPEVLFICIAKQNLKPNQFCKKLAEVIVILNRASSIDKHTKKSQNTCLSLLLRELFLRNSSNNASSIAINPSLALPSSVSTLGRSIQE